ncbi:DUF1771-domain-containing protein [Mycena venus]|uniref:DUF1771-domain-containing protein n=1 Tax=Mycena venus TaxID=2733690 RepID=A0A8H6XVN3_9AGAR|nr:DUF1771-domain-containing protein [Mycena venus]
MGRFFTVVAVAAAIWVISKLFFTPEESDGRDDGPHSRGLTFTGTRNERGHYEGWDDDFEYFPPRRPPRVQILPPSPRRTTRPTAVDAPLSSDALRQLAREAATRMSEAFDQSQIKHRMGFHTQAQQLSLEGKEHRKTMERLNQTASEMIFREKNKNRKPNEFDLHGLYVKEAELKVREIISAEERGDCSSIRFIVGQGLHSTNGDAKLKPKMISYIQELGRPVSTDPRNAGVLVVSLA